MRTETHVQAFSRTLASALLDFKAAVERRDKPAAHLHYALACGLIGGATLSGGIRKGAGLNLMATLEETRSALMDAFGEAPTFDVSPIE